MKNFILFILAIAVIGGGAYWYTNTQDRVDTDTQAPIVVDDTQVDTGDEVVDADILEPQFSSEEVIGSSAEGRDITAYHFGTGSTELLFVGGLHGGYEWNTTLVAYELVDYLAADEARVPENVRVTVIPVANPDGLFKTLGTTERFDAMAVTATEAQQVAGRFNGNGVDLNRNFDCDWQAEGTWQDKKVSGGTAPFSEPEAAAIRDYIAGNPVTAAVVWYASANGVFASNCHNGVSDETRTLMNTYAGTSGYPAYDSFDFYAVTGDMVNWLAKNDVPAISVLLSDHENTEWEKNKKGIDAVLKYYAQ